MKISIQWLPNSGMAMVAQTASGHLLTMDGAPEGGGNNLAPRPMEVFLSGAAACSTYDVILILKKGRQAIVDCRVEVNAERAIDDPKVFTQIHFHYIVTGSDLKPAMVERAIQLSKEKYCSASIMLGATATISSSYEIHPSPTSNAAASVN